MAHTDIIPRRLYAWQNPYKHDPEMPPMTGDFIKTMREDMQLSQAQLGDRMRLSRSYINALERDDWPITQAMAIRFANVYHYWLERGAVEIPFTREEIDFARQYIQNPSQFDDKHLKLPAFLIQLATCTPVLREAYLSDQSGYSDPRELRLSKQRKSLIYRKRALKTRVHRPYGMSITKMSDRP